MVEPIPVTYVEEVFPLIAGGISFELEADATMDVVLLTPLTTITFSL